MRIGHGFQRGEGFGRNDEERLRWIKTVNRFGEIGPVDVRNESEKHVALAVILKGFVRHDGTEIGTADADVDDVPNALARVAFPFAAPHVFRSAAILSSTA